MANIKNSMLEIGFEVWDTGGGILVYGYNPNPNECNSLIPDSGELSIMVTNTNDMGIGTEFICTESYAILGLFDYDGVQLKGPRVRLSEILKGRQNIIDILNNAPYFPHL